MIGITTQTHCVAESSNGLPYVLEPFFAGTLEECRAAARAASRDCWTSKFSIYRYESFSGFSKWLHIETVSKGQLFTAALHKQLQKARAMSAAVGEER